MRNRLAIHADFAHQVRMQKCLYVFFNAFGQDIQTGDLDAASRSGTGTDKHHQNNKRSGKRSPLVEVDRRIACRRNNG